MKTCVWAVGLLEFLMLTLLYVSEFPPVPGGHSSVDLLQDRSSHVCSMEGAEGRDGSFGRWKVVEGWADDGEGGRRW